MPAVIIDGKKLSKKIREQLKRRVKQLKQKNIPVGLAAVVVGNDPASLTYLKIKKNACAEIGINYQLYHRPANTPYSELSQLIRRLNQNSKISGIIIQLPLPAQINPEIIEEILPEKDVDGLTAKNLGALFQIKNFAEIARKRLLVPATPLGVITILQKTNIPIAGKNVVVVGRSKLVGKPLAHLFLSLNATVTIAHSQTKNLKKTTSSADILAVAIGRPKFITADMVKKGATVIDVGISKTTPGLQGDVDFISVRSKANRITPVPGGVGPMTVTMLLQNTILAAEKQNFLPPR